jgi:hypothetical protein
VVTSTFYGFHPKRVARAIPDAWTIADPEAVLAARLTGVNNAARELLGAAALGAPQLAEAADLAWTAAAAADTAGRTLAAANQALPAPEPAHLRLWQGLTTLREHRGDGHIAALLAHRIGPAQSHLLKAAAGESDPETLRVTRQWDAAEWAAALESLVERGLLTADGGPTAAGERVHAQVEELTDELATGAYRALGEAGTRRLATLLRPVADAVVASGVLPIPNPMGLAWPPQEW